MMGFIGLITLFLLTRLPNLLILPIFADEAIYIRWAQLINQGKIFIPLSDGKTPLFMWLLAPLLRLGADPLLTGRILSVTAGLVTVMGIYFLAKKLFDQPTALWAAGLAVFQPFLLFYDRMSLTDGLLTALVVWSLYFSLIISNGIILGIVAGAVLLTKPSGLLFLIMNLLFIKAKKVKPGVVAALIAFGLYNLLRLSDSFPLISSRSADYLRSRQEVISGIWQYYLSTGKVFLSWLVSYLSWPVIILILLSLLLAVRKKIKAVVLLFFWALIPLLIQIGIGKIIYPRYLLPLVPVLLIILAWSIRQFKFGWLLILFFIPWLKFDWYLLANPARAPLDPWEQNQYLKEWSAGYGLQEIKDYLLSLPKDQQVLAATEGSFGTLPEGLAIYFDRSPNIQISGVGFPSKIITPGMEEALRQGKQVFFVVNYDRYNFSDVDRLRLVSQYPRPGGEKLLFYEVY